MSGFVTRAATGDDYSTFARLFPELGVPEATPSADRFTQLIVPGAIVLHDGREAVGYGWGRARGECFHVVHVIVDPAHRKRGVGRALMAALATRAKSEGFVRWMLNVKPENVAGRALYERFGMQVTLESVSMRLEWIDVAHLPRSEGTRPRLLASADDERFEQALGAPAGEIDSYRALGRILVGIERVEDRAPLGFLAFDPPFPGASPFRVRAPEHARALLESVRAKALPELGHLLLFVEGNPALEAVLTAAGARSAMRVLRMEGEIPP